MQQQHSLTYVFVSIGADLGREVCNQPFYVSHISHFLRDSQGFIKTQVGQIQFVVAHKADSRESG
jgi:hypothetical protein